MQRTKKKVLGLAGLAAVGTMTAVAFSLPNVGVSATDGEVNVQVTVNPSEVTSTITSPRDGATIVDGMLQVSSAYNNVDKIEYYLSNKDASKEPQNLLIETFVPTDNAGIHNMAPYDLKRFGYGEYILRAFTTYKGGATSEDSVSFTYSAVSVDVDPGNKDPNPTPGKNPVIDVEVDDNVDYVDVIVTDKDGKPVKDKNGNDIVIRVDKDDIDENGKLKIELPFDKYGIPEGEYYVTIIGYDKDGNIISKVSGSVFYTPATGTGPNRPVTPVTPETPNTGSGLLSDLNISNADYLITGIIVFVIAAGGALFLVFRKNKSDK